MAYNECIVDLYSAVFNKQRDQFKVGARDIIDGMQEIGEAYAPDPEWESKCRSSSDYYEDAARRCAYLHKYAMIHTGLLCDLLDHAVKVYAIKEVIDKGTDCLRICSLGSGPGTDIVAFFFILKEYFETKQIKASLIDCCGGWKSVFEAILSELKKNVHAWDMLQQDNFKYEYLAADLLNFDGHDPSVTSRIKSADIITMVKFVSAAACKDTKKMVKSIISAMKPGALLFFVDNAAGGFHEVMSKTARECGMKSVIEPFRHHHYKQEAFLREFCKWKSQYEAKVAFEVWKKTEMLPLNTTQELQCQFFRQPRTNLGTTFTDNDFPVLESYKDIWNHGGMETQIYDESVRLQCARPPPLSVDQIDSVSKTKDNQKCCLIM